MLPAKEPALLVIGLHALVTEVDEDRLLSSARRAVKAGARIDEIVCVLELVSVIGLHSAAVGVPILVEEMGRLAEGSPATAHDGAAGAEGALRDRGPRPRPLDEVLATLLRADPEYFARFTTLIEVPWHKEDVLDQRFKHLVCVAIDAACTHLYADGIRRHVRTALELGVTPDEILEVSSSVR